MDTLSLTSISPASGASGIAVAFTGTGFGASQGSGVAWLGSVAGQVVSWSDTQVVATVAFNALTGIARIQQNNVWSNSFGFTVPVSGGGTAGNTVTPAMLNMAVGDTHTIQALSPSGLPATGLTWTSSDPTVVSLSTDYPPILSALAAGHVTITAGAASADVTVSAGALALGTVLWSNPGDGSGVKSIVPAVPSATGVADVFAIQNDGTIQAITSDGATAWTANLGNPYGYVIPDFQGGLVAWEVSNDGFSSSSIVKFDGITGQPYPAYTPAPPASLGYALPVVHADGTIFAMESSSSGEGAVNVIGIDPTTGTQKFSVQVVGQEIDGYIPGGPYGIMIAGDGYAYLPYLDQDFLGPVGAVNWVSHFMLLRVDSSGNYVRIHVQDWPSLADFQEEGWERSFNMITNADQGIVLTWRLNNPIGIYNGMAVTTGTSASVVSAPSVPGQVTNLVPVLQAQDGSFVGTAGVGDPDNPQNNMVAFDASGNVRWVVQDEQPQIATEDGGVIGQSGTTYDQYGNATGMINVGTQSWLGYAYQIGSVDEWLANVVKVAKSWWPFGGGNASGNQTAVLHPPYAQLDSCNDRTLHPPPACPGPKDAIFNSWYWLKQEVSDPTRSASLNTYVFNDSTGVQLKKFIAYLGLGAGPEFYDGEKSNVQFHDAGCNLNGTVHNYFVSQNDAQVCWTAAATCRLDPTKPLRTFFEPRSIILGGQQVPYSAQVPYSNAATLFHEALHGFLQLVNDTQLQAFLGCTQPVYNGGSVDSRDITIYLQQFIGPQPPPTPPNSCVYVENHMMPGSLNVCVSPQ
jgi:hypothetical protein